MAGIKRRAVFLDRDGTLVYPYHYPSRPEHLRLYEGVGPALCALQEMGYMLVIITNQSGLAHGYFNKADLQAMHAYLSAELGRWNVHLAGIYYCPHHPDGVVPELSIVCDCRKPRPGLLLRAAAELDVDLMHSWFVGDILADVEAGKQAGCRTILVDQGTEGVPTTVLQVPSFVACDTLHALRIIEHVSGLASKLDLVYVPPSWRVEDTEALNETNCAEEVGA